MPLPANSRPVDLTHPEWSRDATIYQINIRQFTEAGTFDAAAEQLPRLRELGVQILWLMPVQEIGVNGRSGRLGSPYAIKDYYAVNPEFGTMNDLLALTRCAHDLGFRVILDWVANHVAPDNPLVEQHPDWFLRDDHNSLTCTPWSQWMDIVELDYRQPGLHTYMIDAMQHWLIAAELDGFRCDVAGYIPTGFWDRARFALEEVREVFMLAEWEARDLHRHAFDATYAWSWYEAMRLVAQGGGTGPIREYYSTNEKAFPRDAFRMTFVSNHDKNSWIGTECEVFGDAVKAVVALAFVGEGIPLIYNGQEAGSDKRLAFFDRDPIQWRTHPHWRLYHDLISLKRSQQALWNGAWGGRMAELHTTDPENTLAFYRRMGSSLIVAIFNFSTEARTIAVRGGSAQGEYKDALSGGRLALGNSYTTALAPWEFRIFTRLEGTP